MAETSFRAHESVEKSGLQRHLDRISLVVSMTNSQSSLHCRFRILRAEACILSSRTSSQSCCSLKQAPPAVVPRNIILQAAFRVLFVILLILVGETLSCVLRTQ